MTPIIYSFPELYICQPRWAKLVLSLKVLNWEICHLQINAFKHGAISHRFSSSEFGKEFGKDTHCKEIELPPHFQKETVHWISARITYLLPRWFLPKKTRDQSKRISSIYEHVFTLVLKQELQKNAFVLEDLYSTLKTFDFYCLR